MPILHSIIHRIDKRDGESPARVVPASGELEASAALDELLAGLNDAYHAKAKSWGRFNDDTQASLPGHLKRYLDDELDFTELTHELAHAIAPWSTITCRWAATCWSSIIARAKRAT
ncbi:nucleoid-associated protein NdpA [Halomonas elongata]|uniref:Nucleoid-associated protein NdpA n=1 Tax=Halomonas elongata TaxID=2746 RepID=A0A1B8P373_HALEL|nr:nucleoid-associated protein NdpA [Halomonas elongata]